MSAASLPGQWGCVPRPGLGRRPGWYENSDCEEEADQAGSSGGDMRGQALDPMERGVQSEWEWEGVRTRGLACGIGG